MAAGPRRPKTTPDAFAPANDLVTEAAGDVMAPVAEAVAETPAEPVVEAVTETVVEPAVETVAAVAETAAAVAEKPVEVMKKLDAELPTSFVTATKSLQAFSTKALEAYKANAAASVEYVQALAGVRSVSEAIALQSEHMRKQYETFSAQAKELTALAQQVAVDAAAPLKEQFDKAFKGH